MRKKNTYFISSPGGIEEKIFVPINGQEQYLHLRGRNVNNPVILCLHGGPANPDSFLTYEYVDALCDAYTLVSWDQRGCGRTYYKNAHLDPENKTATFEQAVEDVDAVVRYLCQRFQKDSVILLGHSYGTLLGTRYVAQHPERVSSYLGIGQSISIQATQAENHREILSKLLPGDPETAKIQKAYSDYQAHPDLHHLNAFQRLTIPYYPTKKPEAKKKSQLRLILTSPDFAWDDLRWMLGMLNIQKHYTRNKQLMDYTLSADLSQGATDFSVPMYFLSGECDRVCHVELTRRFFDSITAPDKMLVLMPGCGHSPQIDDPVQFAAEVKKLLASSGAKP